MRHPLLATAFLSAALAWPGGISAQVSPFSVRENGGQNRPQPGAPPDVQQRAAQDEAATIAPEPGRPRTVLRPTDSLSSAPFDINGDGRSPQLVAPDETREVFRPATTTSPLASERTPATILPLDGSSLQERRRLTDLLRSTTTALRELRVVVANQAEWVDAVVDRPIVPDRTLRLDGEIAAAAWNVYLSAGEAARGGTLSIAFTNSVLVLPEASRMRVFLNGRQIAQTAIDSPDRTKLVALPIGPDNLRPGENALRIEADMRHRIDCSIDATFELWTRIDTRLTGFSFQDDRVLLSGLADIPAVGVGTSGATRIRVLQRAPQSSLNMERMLSAAQATALRGRFVHPLVEAATLDAAPSPAPGTVNVAIGTHDQLRGIMPHVPREAANAPVATLVDSADFGPTVFITGPTETDVDRALARYDTQERGIDGLADIAATPPWLAPDSVPISGGQTITLRQAGVATLNFSGRRFLADFNVTLPPDFYAAAYGEATLLLDAAYAGEVEAGSRLAVIVNGVLSTAISFASSTGEVYNDFRIALAMTNFRPGVNTIAIAADLETEADRVCLPGGTVPAGDRFALFSSTRLVFRPFARIGQLPNLAAFANSGFPYMLDDGPVRIRVGGSSLETIGAAGTLMSRVAVSRGGPLETSVVDTVGAFSDSGAIIVAPLEDVSSLTLETVGIAGAVPQSWTQPFSNEGGASEPDGLERYDAVLRRLHQQLRQEEVLIDEPSPDAAERPPRADGPLSGLGNLMRSVTHALNIDLRFGPPASNHAAIPSIPDGTTLVFAQAPVPQNAEAAWTLVTAPTPGLLSTSLAAVSTPANWNRIGGRIASYDLQNDKIDTVAVENVSYLATQPLSFANFRLIAANWFSINNGVYALALIVVALGLGLLTWLLVTPTGRKN